MTSNASLLPSSAALCVAALTLAAAPTTALATPEFRVPVVVCVPGDTQSMDNELKLQLTGVARQHGRNPPPRTYYCPVFNPDFTTPIPAWRQLKLMVEDTTGLSRNVTARLYQKGASGTAEIAKVSSGAAVGIQVVSALFPGPLDFSRYSYYMTVEMSRPAGITPDVVDAHEVRLTD